MHDDVNTLEQRLQALQITLQTMIFSDLVYAFSTWDPTIPRPDLELKISLLDASKVNEIITENKTLLHLMLGSLKSQFVTPLPGGVKRMIKELLLKGADFLQIRNTYGQAVIDLCVDVDLEKFLFQEGTIITAALESYVDFKIRNKAPCSVMAIYKLASHVDQSFESWNKYSLMRGESAWDSGDNLQNAKFMLAMLYGISDPRSLQEAFDLLRKDVKNFNAILAFLVLRFHALSSKIKTAVGITNLVLRTNNVITVPDLTNMLYYKLACDPQLCAQIISLLEDHIPAAPAEHTLGIIPGHIEAAAEANNVNFLTLLLIIKHLNPPATTAKAYNLLELENGYCCSLMRDLTKDASPQDAKLSLNDFTGLRNFLEKKINSRLTAFGFKDTSPCIESSILEMLNKLTELKARINDLPAAPAVAGP